ncbi:hypothetical protein NL676_016984 [Syzygium grande]|nr:hypothetical protein NL676_016984 [Syzygium grande]
MPLHSIKFDVGPEFHQGQLKEFTLVELCKATQNFSHINIIGRGGFGKVYKETQNTQFLLVYPFLINISLEKCLRKRNDNQPPLDWPTRIKIAVGAARGLSHLHDLKIVHRDIKAANIMLDEEFEPHIGDFGLAKLIVGSHGGYCVDCIEGGPILPRNESKAGSDSGYCDVTTAVRGTVGHIAPEYLSTRKCSVKTDVFAFGIMLLELVTGQRAFDPGRLAMMLLDWVKGFLEGHRWDIPVDPDLQGAYDEEEIEKVIQLALVCTQFVPRKRPSMAQVVRILEGHSIKERWEEHQTCEPNWHLVTYTDWIVAVSTSHLRAEKLFEPK